MTNGVAVSDNEDELRKIVNAIKDLETEEEDEDEDEDEVVGCPENQVTSIGPL